jgi:tight adherence protein B
MEVVILVLAGFALLAIVGGVIASVRAGPAARVEERLSRYSGDQLEATVQDAPVERVSPIAPLADRLEEAVTRRSFSATIKAELQQADLKLKVSEYLTLTLAAVAGFGVIGWFLFGGSPLFAGISAAVGFFAPRVYVSRRAGMRRRDFDNLLGDTLNLWVNALRSGYSVLQAMETIASETPPPINMEFERVVQEVRLGLTLEAAMSNLLERIRSADMDLVVTAVNIQREVGGNLAEVLSIISHTIRERIRIRGEIQVLTAQVMISGSIISLLPVALTLFLRMSNPEYINELFVRDAPWVFPDVIPCGWLVLGLGVILIFSGFMAMRKIGDIEI